MQRTPIEVAVRSHTEESILACRGFGPGRLLMIMLVIAVLSVAASPAALAQPVRYDCPPSQPTSPGDGFVSGGFGLTCDEMVALHGPFLFGQGSLYWTIGGVETHLSDRGLSLHFRGGAWRDAGAFASEIQAAESLLPADAEFVGRFDLGGALRSYQEADLYHSSSLARRYTALGEPRSGDILVVTTFADDSIDRGPVEMIQITAARSRG